MFESGHESVYFLLGSSPSVRTTLSSKEAMREHFEALEAAWRAAKEEAAED
jgi:hypothetical protein